MLLIKPPRIPSKIFLKDSLDALGRLSTWNILDIRVVITALQPVGGAESATVTMFLAVLKLFSPARS